VLRRGSLEGLEALGRYTGAIRSTTHVRQVRGDGRWLSLRMTARMWSTGEEGPMHVTRRGDRLALDAPPFVRAFVEDDDLDMTGAFSEGGAQVFLKAVEDGTEWDVPTESFVRLTEEEDEGVLRPQVKMLARVAPTVAAGGAPLPPGQYEVRAALSVAGFSHVSRARREDEIFTVTVTAAGRLEHWRPPAPPPPPAPPAPVRMRRAAAHAARQVPGVRPAFRRARRAVGAR
jgi:hypothetical protein